MKQEFHLMNYVDPMFRMFRMIPGMIVQIHGGILNIMFYGFNAVLWFPSLQVDKFYNLSIFICLNACRYNWL